MSALFDDIGAIVSDKVYDETSNLEYRLQEIEEAAEFTGFGIDGGFGQREYLDGASHRFEWEFGKNAIVVTDYVTGNYVEKSTGKTIPAGPFRHVIEGSFEYDKGGKLVSGSITGFARWVGKKNGSILYSKFDETPVSFSGDNFQELHNAAASGIGESYFYSPSVDETAETAETPYLWYFRNYGISRYFEDNWWDNLFATNLVEDVDNTNSLNIPLEQLSDNPEALLNQVGCNKALMGGNDFIEIVGGVNNFANGNDGIDYIILRGGQGKYLGGEGDDYIEVFTTGLDTFVNGNQGDDYIVGEVDIVTYRGGIGDDIMDVSVGNVWGDDGADIFKARAGSGVAIIQDYATGEDSIQGVLGGSLTLTDNGLSYGVGNDQMLLLMGITDVSQVSFT